MHLKHKTQIYKLFFVFAVLTEMCSTPLWGQWTNIETKFGLAGVPGLVNATGRTSKFNSPEGVAFNNVGAVPSVMYVADTYNHVIRRVVLATGEATTIAGSGVAGWADGVGTAARFNGPRGVAVDSTNTYLYVADSNNGAIRKIHLATNAVTTIIGKSCTVVNNPNLGAGDQAGQCDPTDFLPGSGTQSSFFRPYHLIVSYASPMSAVSGGLYVTDQIGNVASVDLSSSPAEMRLVAAIDPWGGGAISCTTAGCASVVLR